ncbi:sodium/solute symporter [Streptomyces sp. NPDC055815]
MNTLSVNGASGGGMITPLTSFLVVVAVVLMLCLYAESSRDEVRDFFTAGRSFSTRTSTLALAGEYASAIGVLGITGLVALTGFDGMSVALDLVLSLLVLLLIAQPVRELGRFTIGGIFDSRTPGRAARIAGSVATLVVCLPYLVAQLISIGVVTAHLAGLSGEGAAQICLVLVGTLMVLFVFIGGMRGTSLIQMLKAVLVFVVLLTVCLVVLRTFHWDVNALIDTAAQNSGRPETYYAQGGIHGSGITGQLNYIGLHLTLVLGTAVVPHVVARLSTSRSGAVARRAVVWTVGATALLAAAIVVLGLGAAATVGAPAIADADPRGSTALLMLAGALAGGPGTSVGSIVFTAVACAVFVTTLAVVSGLTLSASAALGHDLYAHVVRQGTLSERQTLRAVRWSVVLVGGCGILLALALFHWHIQFLAAFGISVAASAILPALVYSLFWGRFTRTGLLWSVYGGLLGCVVLTLFGPTVSGSPGALFPAHDFHGYPLEYPGLITVPLGFALGWAGSVLGRGRVTRSSSGRLDHRVRTGAEHD